MTLCAKTCNSGKLISNKKKIYKLSNFSYTPMSSVKLSIMVILFFFVDMSGTKLTNLKRHSP